MQNGLVSTARKIFPSHIMSFDLYDKQAFLSAVTPAEKPVAFLVGSPLSWDADGGVPGVTDIYSLIREKVKTRKAKSVDRFDLATKGKTGAEQYQTALRWLQGNISQLAVNEVIKEAICRARNDKAPRNFNADGEWVDWHLPQGTKQLAELVCRESETYPGPILTTNFDPLLSLAIKSVGGSVHRRIIDGDGSLGREAESEPGTRAVVHLHGYWRGSDTLHTPAQLTSVRPKLKASLQNLLRQKTLVVVAYAGWDDVFTQALVDLLHDDEAQLDVIWCFYESDPAIVQARYGHLIDKLQPAIARGVFRAYGGVDCQTIFGEILAERAALSTAPEALSSDEPLVSPLPGWQCFDADSLRAMAPLNKAEALRYFDGAVPTWRHALSDLVPRREAVASILKRRENLTDDSPSMQLIRAAGGEGKTTVLLQAAVDAVMNEGVRILWRPSPRLSFSPEQLESLDPSYQWLIVADDAENLVKQIGEAASSLYQAYRANVDFLLAARDADWKASGGDRVAWAQWLQYQPDEVLRGITEGDAGLIVEAWDKAGGLRELAKETNPSLRPEVFLKAVNDAAASDDSRRGDGSFFGGLLAVRFGEAGLRAHVREFLAQLRGVSIFNSERTLADALLYVAACHGAGISGLDENVLADLLGVPRDWIGSRVIRPLGEEAAAVSGGGRVFTRHSQVAAAVLLEAEAALDLDLAEVWARLVRQTVKTSTEVNVHHETHARVIHAGPRLQKNLPQQLPEARRKTIAIAAAKASVAAEPDRLSRIVDLAQTYRKADKVPEAIKLLREQLVTAQGKIDYAEIIRGYWYEWSVCEGKGCKEHSVALANAWLGGISLSDRLNPAQITDERIKLSCAGLAVAFGAQASAVEGGAYALALRAVIDIGRRVSLDPRAESYFVSHEKAADKLGTPCPKDLDEAMAWLTAGVNAAGGTIVDSELAKLATPGKLSFSTLRSKLGGRAR